MIYARTDAKGNPAVHPSWQQAGTFEMSTYGLGHATKKQNIWAVEMGEYKDKRLGDLLGTKADLFAREQANQGLSLHAPVQIAKRLGVTSIKIKGEIGEYRLKGHNIQHRTMTND